MIDSGQHWFGVLAAIWRAIVWMVAKLWLRAGVQSRVGGQWKWGATLGSMHVAWPRFAVVARFAIATPGDRAGGWRHGERWRQPSRLPDPDFSVTRATLAFCRHTDTCWQAESAL
jgi:hypothetical protein